MRILYLTNGFPFPLTSGYLRHYFLIKELAPRHAVTLLSIVGANFVPEHRAALAPFTEKVLTFTSANKSGGSFRQKALRRARELGGADDAVQQMGAAVERLTREGHFDVVLFSGKDTYPALGHLPNLPVVVDMCDATSIKLRGSLRYTHPLRLPLLWWDYQDVRRVERELFRRAAHSLFASVRDREALLGQTADRATVMPNGVDLDFWKRGGANTQVRPNEQVRPNDQVRPNEQVRPNDQVRPDEQVRPNIVFTGAMSYPPNVDAALYLIEDIFPRVRQAAPQAEVFIVGRDPAPSLVRAGQRHPGVTVTGYVDDVRPYLERASVFAAPLRFGAGIQNKVLEAMAMEVPVVASFLAADGLRTEEGQNPPVRVAHSTEDFARQIVDQLKAHAANPAPDAEARRFIEAHFVWSRSGEKLERVLKAVTKVTKTGRGLAKQALRA